ncbi:TetR/AcrR family transcriptional regulator [Streptococcus loxodontisalivarius]|uniref:TetR/AcrR family transcriptional repressor of nem operon n=1 Tax=Streptococcus loxodontisalivarius TaxID=1349415 RepID=A0ABS2PT12_9STRE|nr:TetR/AcrR family transcriptional regulator [Streptococcus loxodontisalivarius]MBM7642690.1 TetR/AcrR family transcriptional repressor of nem operon [Streptococcus loxodontisalivarius]
MSTKDKIMVLGRDLIQERGVNGFSFADIAKQLDIKKASIHYYFPSKADLIEAVLDQYDLDFFEALSSANSSDLEKNLKHFLSLYEVNFKEDKICLCSDLAVDSVHLTQVVNDKVGLFFQKNIDWLAQQLSQKENPQAEAEDFFAAVQGAQLVARNQGGADYFKRVMTRKVSLLV